MIDRFLSKPSALKTPLADRQAQGGRRRKGQGVQGYSRLAAAMQAWLGSIIGLLFLGTAAASPYQGGTFSPYTFAAPECDDSVERTTVVLIDTSYLARSDRDLAKLFISQDPQVAAIISDTSMVPGERFLLAIFDGMGDGLALSQAIDGCWMGPVARNAPQGLDPVRYAERQRTLFQQQMSILFDDGISGLGEAAKRQAAGAGSAASDTADEFFAATVRHAANQATTTRLFVFGNPFLNQGGTPATQASELDQSPILGRLDLSATSLYVFGFDYPDAVGMSPDSQTSYASQMRRWVASRGGWLAHFEPEYVPDSLSTGLGVAANGVLAFAGIFTKARDADFAESQSMQLIATRRTSSTYSGIDWLRLQGISGSVAIPVSGRMNCSDRDRCGFSGRLLHVPSGYEANLKESFRLRFVTLPGGVYGILTSDIDDPDLRGQPIFKFYAVR